MSILIRFEPASVTTEQYDEAVRRLEDAGEIPADGLVSECAVDRGTGISTIDSAVCSIAHERLRFRPAFSRSGQAVAGWFGYAQRAPR